jgi:hypothetical protein
MKSRAATLLLALAAAFSPWVFHWDCATPASDRPGSLHDALGSSQNSEEMSAGWALEKAKESQPPFPIQGKEIFTHGNVEGTSPLVDTEDAEPQNLRAYRVGLGVKMLSEIPRGGLADALNVDLLCNLHKAVFVPDKKGRQAFGYALRALRRGGGPRPGVLRTDWTATPVRTFSEAEVMAMREHGLTLKAFPGTRYGAMKYLPPEEVEPGLQALIQETKKTLNDPATDPVKLAARFKQRFIALHPFEDGNGRVGRLMVDRILAEYGIAAPILENPKMDVTLSQGEYIEALQRGIELARARAPHP